MKINLSIVTGKDQGEVVSTPQVVEVASSVQDENLAVAWREIEQAWSNAADPLAGDEEQKKRQQWVGGAIKVYALITGRDPVEVRDSLPGARPAALPNAYASIAGTIKPVKPSRPPKHPGAQRPVEPSETASFDPVLESSSE